METVVVKIENTYISFAHVKKIGRGYRVIRIRRIALPENLLGEEAGKQPELVASVIVSVMQNGDFPVDNLAVYLGGGTELFAEYRYSETLSESARLQRRKQTEDALLADASEPVYRVKYYPYNGVDGGLAAGAVFAADAAFCDRLKSALIKDGFTVPIISSSLASFAETAKTVSDLGNRVLVLRAEKQEMQAALFTDGKLVRLARFAQGTEAKDPVAPLLPYINYETKIALCGDELRNTLLRDRLKQVNAAAVGSVNTRMKNASERILLSEEFSSENDMFPDAFAAVAFTGEEGETAYLAEARDVKKIGFGIRAAFIVTLIVAVFACALSPVTLYLAERDKEANRALLEEPFYADAATKLEQYRAIVSKYTELLEAEEAMPARDPSHANLLEETIYGLLFNTQIDEMYYEKGKGILVDFTTNDAEAFDAMKERAGRNKDVFIYESKAREELEDGDWHIQIRVSLSPSAPEAQ